MRTLPLLILTGLMAQAAAMRPGYSTLANLWAYACATNSGSVSSRTLISATVWSRDIYSPGLRSMIYRANLFAGDDFAHGVGTSMGSVQVPIIADKGSTLDVNIFGAASWSYAERGSAGGLQTSSGSTLQTSLVPSTESLSISSGHLSAYVCSAANANGCAVGCQKNGSPFSLMYLSAGPFASTTLHNYYADSTEIAPVDSLGVGLYSVSRTSNTLKRAYKNGTQIGSDNTVSNSGEGAPEQQFRIFGCSVLVGTVVDTTTKRLAGYTIGTGLSDADEAALYTAWQRFQTALGRQQ